MRFIVPIKQVPETKSVKMDEKTGTVIREGVTAIINPLDLYAIEAALCLREKTGGEVITLSMGPPKAVEALKESIAMGADSAILVSDRAFAGSDTWATSYVLAHTIGKMGNFDLIICGERATDGDTGQVGPGIAAWLDLPVVAYVSGIDKISPQECQVHRLMETGYETILSTLPVVLTVVKEVSSPRLPTLRGKQKARRMEIPVWDAASLNLDLTRVGLNGSPTRVVSITKPKVTRQGEIFTANDERGLNQALDRLVSFLGASTP